MKQNLWKIGLLAIAVVAFGLLWAYRVHHPNEEAKRIDVVPPPSVSVERPARATVNRIAELPATVAGLQEAKLYAKVSGFLKTVNVDKGDKVTKGQLLATIDSPELERDVQHQHENHLAALENMASNTAQLQKATAEQQQADAQYHRSMARKTEAEADVLRARADQNLARITYKRLKGVYDQDHGLIARQEVDVAEAAVQDADAKLAAAEKGVDASQEEVHVQSSQRSVAAGQIAWVHAQFAESDAQGRAIAESEKQAQDLLSYTEIRAPFDGIITGRFLDPGPLVQSSANTAQEATHPVLSLANFDVVRVYVQVPEPDLPFVRIGSPIHLLVDELPDHVFKGSITRTTGMLDEDTRTMLCECDLPNRAHLLHPGMMIHAQIFLQSHPNALTIPATALTVDSDKKFVYVVDPDNVVKKIPVKVGFEEPARVEITAGLRGDERIVVAGKENISDGTRVRISSADSARI